MDTRDAQSLLLQNYNLKTKLHQKEQRIISVIRYCEPNADQMCAARVIAELLDCDFRDSKAVAQDFLKTVENLK